MLSDRILRTLLLQFTFYTIGLYCLVKTIYCNINGGK